MNQRGQDELAVGRVTIDPERHASLRYGDQATDHEHMITRLEAHPEKPEVCVGVLVVRKAGMIVGEPQEVQILNGSVTATQPIELHPSHKKEIIAGASAISAVVAIGTLFLRHRRKR